MRKLAWRLKLEADLGDGVRMSFKGFWCTLRAGDNCFQIICRRLKHRCDMGLQRDPFLF
jgi:hypothetical protein